jgi:predicted DNA-binding transcriptional regulator AlpA
MDLDQLKESLISPRAGLALSGGISDQTRRRLIAAGEYPKPIVLSRNRHGRPVRIAWIESEIREWIAKKITAARSESAA